MKKLYILICFMLLVIHVPTASAASFSDVDANSELQIAVSQMQAQKIISGYEDGTFRPSKNVTRGQMAKMIAVSLGLTTATMTSSFTDVPVSHPNFTYIQTLVELQIISGYADGSFKPNNYVTRSQVSKMIAKAYSIPSYNASLPFTDITNTNERYADIQALYFNGIASGTTATLFSPSKQVTRGQAALFIFRALQLKNGTKITELTLNDLTNLSVEVQEGYFYKTVIVGNKIRILPLVNGNGKLFIKGSATDTTVPKTDYVLYDMKIASQKLTATKLEWLNYMDVALNYYTLKQLDINFKPTAVELVDQYGVTISKDKYSVGADSNGLEIAVFIPGQFTLTVKGGSTAKAYKVNSTVSQFNMNQTLYVE